MNESRMPKWPQLHSWTLANLLRLQASWQEITPGTAEEKAAHAASMEELAGYIRRATAHAYAQNEEKEPL